ncbi:putative importin subunit beta-4 [Grifola frondosa]|uniref:Putative importin subunit beta-4 n=1 Tax=Grifola frondosa TaxID=5627 RepID=A0A1C7LKF2_GRIFR|nr:putative importin subunit beta-4 [Grifola frondosa]
MDPNFVQGLHNLLVQSTSNDTVQLKAATAQLNREFYKNAACVPALASIIASSPEQAVRQLAAVELRKRVMQNSSELWIQVPQDEREQIKAKLPEIVLAEPSNLVRHATARVIASIASLEIPLSQWPQLLPFLQQTCHSPQAVHREVGVYILYTILENIVEGFESHLQEFFKLFEGLLADPESADVRITTVRALGVIAQYIDADDKADIKSFQNLLPAMITVIGQCVETGNETGARQLFDVLETLLILEIPLLGQHIPQLAQFLLACGSNRNFDSEMRVLSLNALNWTVQYKKSKIQAHGLAPAILEGLMPITTEEEPEDADDDAPSRSALRIIDCLATSLPPTQVFPALRQLIQQYFSSADPGHRRGAMLALGVCVEGCSEFMTPLMGQVWPVIEAGLRDQDASVRKASCIAVSCLCEWLEEDCVAKHATLVPVMMQLVNDPVTQRSACTALDALLEILHDVIDQYLQLIMERLAGLLDSAPMEVKTVVIGAIGSAAHASKAKFLPYFAPTMERFQHFLVLTGEGEEQELRGITMDAVGTFAEAVGKDVFRPYFSDMMKQAFLGIELGSARLRECSFLFFGVMSRVFEEEFAPYLPNVIPALIASCQQPEHGEEERLAISNPEVAASFASGSSPANPITVTDESHVNVDVDGEELLDLDKILDVNSTICIEKEIAADTIGTIFASTRRHFLPYIEQCTLELVGLLPHYYDGIRKSATDSLLEIVRTFYELSDPQEWHPGLAVPNPLDPRVKELVGHVMPALVEMYESEDNKKVVSSLCIGLAETINKLGPAFLEGIVGGAPGIEHIGNIAIQVLDQKAICQQDPDQDESEEMPEDQAEYDSILISSAGDLVAALANALGPEFAPAFQTYFPLISKYYKKNRSLSDRSSAIGCLSEIIGGMKSAITPSTEPLLELFYRALSDDESEVQCNAAFASGLLVEHSEVDLSPQFIHLLAALRPLFVVAHDAPTAKLNARDNAVGAVARMIVKNTAALPLDQVLPVFFEALPLKNDFLENRPVFRAVFHLFKTNPRSCVLTWTVFCKCLRTYWTPPAPTSIIYAMSVGELPTASGDSDGEIWQSSGLEDSDSWSRQESWMAKQLEERRNTIGGIDNLWLLLSDAADFNPVCASIYSLRGKVSLDLLTTTIMRQVEKFPRYHQRLTSVGRMFRGPRFEDDPDFDIKNHICIVKLPEPGGKQELEELVGKFIAKDWDLRRPLWESMLVDNYHDDDGAECVLITRGHHTLSDGQGFMISELYVTSYSDDLVEAMNSSARKLCAARRGRLLPSEFHKSLSSLDSLSTNALASPLLRLFLATFFWIAFTLSSLTSFFWSTYQVLHLAIMFLITCWRVEMLTGYQPGRRVTKREFSSSKTFSLQDVKLCQLAFSGPRAGSAVAGLPPDKRLIARSKVGHITLNDVVCSVMADVIGKEIAAKPSDDAPRGRFRRYLDRILPLPIGFFIPISMRSPKDWSMRNELHTHIHECHAELSLLKHSMWPKIWFHIMQWTSQVPALFPVPFALFPTSMPRARNFVRRWVTKPIVELCIQSFPVVLTNVPGPPKKPINVAGIEIIRWAALPLKQVKVQLPIKNELFKAHYC